MASSNIGTILNDQMEAVAVLKVSNPGDISVRITKSTKEFTAFDKLSFELSTMFGNDHYAHFKPFEVGLGKNYVGRIPSKCNQWCRVRVEDIMVGTTSNLAICDLIDYGEQVTVENRCLRQVHQKYFDLPPQVKSVSLANIVPAALLTDMETFNTDLRESKTWNPSATECLKTLVLGRLNVRIKYLPSSKHKVIMYVQGVCVNDELVDRRLALPVVVPAWKQPKKIMTFEESQELERRMEEEELTTAVVYQQEMDLPIRMLLDDSEDSARPSARPEPAHLSPERSFAPVSLPAKGRGKSLLAALEKSEKALAVSSDDGAASGLDSVHSSSVRLPRTQSIAQTCSPPRPTDASSSSNGRLPQSTPQSHLPNHQMCRGDGSTTLHKLSNGTTLPDSDGSLGVGRYKKSRRPNLDKRRPDDSNSSAGGLSEPSSSLNGVCTPTSRITTAQRLQNIQATQEVQDVRPKTNLKSPYFEPDMGNLSIGDNFSGKPKRGVSFSDTDEIKEFVRGSPIGADQLALSSSFDSDDAMYNHSAQRGPEETGRIYQKTLRDFGNSYETEDRAELTAISYDQSKWIALKKQATVFSDLPITPIFSIQNSKLHDRALRHWRSLGGSDSHPLRTIQAYGWPALRRGMELVAVTDKFYMEGRDGVSLSYLMAAATLLFDVDSYKCLPEGGGARCLILCASWLKAEQIYFHVASLFGEKPVRSLLVLHGRRETEQKLSCQLINGTDVIVSTPCTFVRMLESGHASVDRLCHLFIDDADIITKEFPTQLSVIMKEFGLAVSQNSERAAPRQIALFSSSWTDRIGLFRDEFMTAAVTIITNKIEASVASNVKQVVHYIEGEEQRLGTMLKLVNESGSPAIKVVVCTHTESDATKVYQALQAYSREVYLAMKSLNDLDQAIKLWEEVRSENSYPILVITDEVLQLLIYEDNPIVDARYVLHYNMPANKRLLGLRLHCLSSNYSENTAELMLSTHIIFSPDDHQAATTIVKMLDKTGSEVPDKVRQLSIRAIERNETGKKKELCSYMKSFGVCRDHLKCTARHLVSRQLDTPSPSLPTSGDIEFKVVSVKDAATCYARLIRHRDMAGLLHALESKKFYLDLSLQAFFSQPHIKICIDPATIEQDRICVYEKDSVFYRVRIVQPSPDPSTQYIPAAWVLLLDEGGMMKVQTRHLYELPECSSFEKFPLEIVEIIICKLKPMDDDLDWSSEANAFMAQLLTGEILSGKIQLCLGTTIWCDPIVKRRYLNESAIWVSLWYASLKLVGDVNTGHLAAQNPQHIELLKSACTGKMVLPVTVRPPKASRVGELIPDDPFAAASGSGDVIAISTSQLNETDFSHVYLTEIDDPELIFLMRTEQHERLVLMEEELGEYIRTKGKRKLKSATLRTLCVARFPEDNRWCRCVVISHTNGKLQLLAVDYGRLFRTLGEEVSSLPPLPEDLTILPYQAIECHLATVMPPGGGWSTEAGDLIWDQCGQCVTLYAKVMSKRPAKFIGDTSYGVELIEVQTDIDLHISHLLINKGLAAERKLNIMQQLGVEFDTDQLDYPFQRIPKLIRFLNKTESHERRLLIVEYIRQLVHQGANLKHEMRRSGIVKNLCTLVNSVNLHDELLYHVIECFILLTSNNLDNCEEMWWEKGFTYLHEQLEMCDDNGLLTKVLICLKNLIRSDSIKQETDNLESFTSNLIHTARTSSIAQNKIYAMDILSMHVQGSEKRMNLLLKQDVVAVVTNLLSINNDEIVMAGTQLIDSLVSASPNQPTTGPWTDTLTHLALRIFKIKTDSALFSCARTLDTMLRNLNGATAILKSTRLHEKVQRLVNSGLNTRTREACINVLIKVKPDLPPTQLKLDLVKNDQPTTKTQQKIYLEPISKGTPSYPHEMKVPAVLWWECSKFLMIQVQVHDALSLDPLPILNYKAGKLRFQCGDYQFKLGPLYGRIVSQRSRREVLSSEIKYALYKEKAEIWSKLMSPGHKKPSFVQPNMDSMITSSDDEADIDYSKSPFLIKPRPSLRYSVFDTIRGQPKSIRERAPPVDEYLSSEEEEDDEEDERYDQEYKKQYEFFNV